MSCKEIVRLLESNIWAVDKLADKLRMKPAATTGYPRQQMAILVRLHQGGRARLKDIARREHISAPNLCSVFRKLERDGLVLRVIDEQVLAPWLRLIYEIGDCFRNKISKKK